MLLSLQQTLSHVETKLGEMFIAHNELVDAHTDHDTE